MKAILIALAVVLIPGGLVGFFIYRVSKKQTDALIARIKARGHTEITIESDGSVTSREVGPTETVDPNTK